jgi:uncharacterized protein YjbI with pentapeptide repeats
MAAKQPTWERCGHDGCIGVRLLATTLCLAHAAEQAPDAFDAELKRIGAEGTVDARGVSISPELLQRLLAATPRDDARPALTTAKFEQATFQGEAGFGGVRFQGDAWFDGATFRGAAVFEGATFRGLAVFHGTTFRGEARFNWATFRGGSWFDGATFRREAVFDGATFRDGHYAGFKGATFRGWAGFNGATIQDGIIFEGAIFRSNAYFIEVTFRGGVVFRGATFRGWAGFNGATFRDAAVFDGATFQREAMFDRATFQGGAGFSEATFQDDTEFLGVVFRDAANLYAATFVGEARFYQATFEDLAWFPRAIFRAEATFVGAMFRGQAMFGMATFEHWADFRDATFEMAREFGPVLTRRQLIFDGATFHQRVQIDAAAATLCARRARFPAGVQLRLRWAQVVLDDADLAAPSILSGVPPFAKLNEDRFARAWRRLPPAQGRDGRPRLLSMRRADVAGLTVANADLRACRFLGAHNLDKLRVEGDAILGDTPGPWRWTTRQTIAEEHHWRATRTIMADATLRSGSSTDWYPAYCRPPDWLEVEEVTPAQIATLYRSRRKSREDNKDEPGAADFYYGEMEMRRHARHEQARQERRRGHWGTWASARIEHAILWLYWLISGYALRAWRALVALAATLVVFAVLCVYGGGFASQSPQTATAEQAVTTTTPSGPTPTTRAGPSSTTIVAAPTNTATVDASLGGAMVYGARTIIGLTRDPQPRLTRWGEVLQILLRLIAPVLLGLSIFSVRGRVKR